MFKIFSCTSLIRILAINLVPRSLKICILAMNHFHGIHGDKIKRKKIKFYK